MNSELAFKLRQADFPNKQIAGSYLGRLLYIFRKPTLSELIEACGDDFQRLIKIDGKWRCSNDRVITQGSTPEEAVARLWLWIKEN